MQTGGWPRLVYKSAVVLFMIDRILKDVALSGASAGNNIAAFDLFRNSGIAFSLPLPDAAFWPVAILVYAVLAWLFIISRRRQPLMAAVIVLVLAGATSNVADRIMYGATIDYLILFDRSAVNLADGMILGGIIAIFTMTRKISPGQE